MVKIIDVDDRYRLILIGTANLLDERGFVIEKSLERIVKMLRHEREDYRIVVALEDLDCMSIQTTRSLATAHIHSPAFAALKQTRLLSSWSRCLEYEGLMGGQVLLDRGALGDPARVPHLRATFDALFLAGVVPIVGYASASHAVGQRAIQARGLESGLIDLLRAHSPEAVEPSMASVG